MDYIGPPYIRSDAARKTRLINFDSTYAPAGYKLKPAHEAELDKLLQFVSHTTDFSVWIVGYASKVGNHKANVTLSWNRALAVERYLKAGNSLFADPDRLAVFQAKGDEGYIAGNKDNSADERAVEVHVFLGRVTPPPPPVPVPPRPRPPLPGGARFTRWEVASPGGVFIGTGIGGGFNIFFIRNTKLNEVRGYLQGNAGIGAGLSLSGLGAAGRIIQTVLTGGGGSAPDFTDVTPPEPTTWEEVEGCLVRVAAAGAGLIKGASGAVITFSSSGVYHYGPSGSPLRTSMDLWQFLTVGENWQLGVSANDVVGPLTRVG